MVISFLIFVKWISESFTFTKFRENFYVRIISLVSHQNDVTTRRFWFRKGSTLIFFWWEYFLFVQLTMKEAWKSKIPKMCELSLRSITILKNPNSRNKWFWLIVESIVEKILKIFARKIRRLGLIFLFLTNLKSGDKNFFGP